MTTDEIDNRIQEIDRLLVKSQNSYYGKDETGRLSRERHFELWDEMNKLVNERKRMA